MDVRAADKKDGWMICDFRSFQQYFSGMMADDNERLCAVEPCLQLRRICLEAGLELGTVRSVGQSLTH